MPVVAGGHSYKRTHRGKERFPGFTITYALMEALEKVMEDTNGGGDAATLALDEMLAASASVVHDAQTAVSFCTVKAKDQRRAMEMLDADAGLRTLKRIEAPLFDMEIRGVPALQFMGGQVWTD